MNGSRIEHDILPLAIYARCVIIQHTVSKYKPICLSILIVVHAMNKNILCHMGTTTANNMDICSLISTFVVHYVDSIIPIDATSELSRLQLAFVA